MHEAAALRARRERMVAPAIGPVDEHALHAALIGAVLFLRDAVGRRDERVKAHLLLRAGVGVGHLRRRRADARRVDEGEHRVVAHGLDERERVVKFGVRLAGETHDDVRREHKIGHVLPRERHLRQIFLARVAAVHRVQDAVVAALHGQVHLVRALFALGHGAKELFRRVLRVAAHEADDKVARDGVEPPDEVGKVHVLVEVAAVGVDILPQERDVLIARRDELARLALDLVRVAGALAPAHIWHDAVGAEVVAPVHDRQPCLDAAVALLGDALGHAAVRRRDGEHPPVLGADGAQQLREAPQLMRAEDEVDDAVGLFQLLGHVFLLRHAAADRDDLVGVARLGMRQRADVAEHARLGVLTHGAGVHDDDVGREFVLCEIKAHGAQITAQLFAVGLVLLAAVGIDHGQRLAAAGGKVRAQLRADIQLVLDVRFGDLRSLIAHAMLLPVRPGRIKFEV